MLDMSGTCPTVRVKANLPGGFCLINESDFDPEKHVLFAAEAAEPVPIVAVPLVIAIPADWQSLHWKQRLALAEKLTGNRDLAQAEGQKPADAADAVIAAEIARRSGG
ncbi:MAG: hypothetical protein ABII76_08680 [Pseudomonadota bacterium]